MRRKVPAPSGRSTDAAARREARLTREAALLEQGRNNIRAGRCIGGAELEAWLDGLGGSGNCLCPGKCPVEGHMIMYEVNPDTDDNRTAGDVEILRVFGPHQLRDRL